MLLSSSHMEQVQKAANFFWKFKELHKATQQLQQLSPYPFLPGAQALKGSTAASRKQTRFLFQRRMMHISPPAEGPNLGYVK